MTPEGLGEARKRIENILGRTINLAKQVPEQDEVVDALEDVYWLLDRELTKCSTQDIYGLSAAKLIVAREIGKRQAEL